MASPYITGSDLISNPGNAALGYSSGVGYNANPAAENPFPGIQSSLNLLQQEEVFNRQRAHTEKRKEQEDLAQYLATTGQSLFNLPAGENGQSMSFSMLDGDRRTLTDRTNENMRMVTQNLGGYKYDLNLKKKEIERKQLLAHAGLRSATVSNLEQQAAKTQDPEERNAILQHINDIKSQKVEDFIHPEPYLPKQTFDPNIYYPADIDKNKEYRKNYSVASVDENGNQITREMSGYADNVADFRANAQPGSALYGNTVKMAQAFYGSPRLNNALHLLDMNKNIDLINEQRGYAPGSPHFIPHIAEVFSGGKVQYNNLSPADVVYAINQEARGGLQKNDELKKTAQEVKKEQADITGKNLQNEKTRKEIDQMDEELEIKKQNAEANKKSMSKAEHDEEMAKIGAQQKVLKVIKTFEAFNNSPSVRAVKPIEESNPEEYEDLRKSGNVDFKGYRVMRIPLSQETKAMGGEQDFTEAANGIKQINGSLVPKEQLYLYPPSGELKEGRLAYKYEKGTGKDKTTFWKIVDMQQAISGLISDEDNYKQDKTYKHDVASQYFNENYGKIVPGGKKQETATKTPTSNEKQEYPAAIMALGKVVKFKKAPNGQTYYRIDNIPGKLFRADGSDGTNDTF